MVPRDLSPAEQGLVREAFLRDYPTRAFHGTKVRSEEPERLVVAVFWQIERLSPNPYTIYEIAIDLSFARELDGDESAAYTIKNYK